MGRKFLNKLPSLPKGFYKSQIKVKYLSLRNMGLYTIETNAFDTKEFINLMTLELIQVPIMNFMEGIFTGLQNLKVLILHGLNIHSIAPNLLKPLENLESLTIKSCGKEKISVDNLFGYDKLNRLAHVTIDSCALKDTITVATFTGLWNVSELRLENDHIQKIGSHAFNIPMKTLEILSLERNSLKILPDDLFNTQHMSFVRIYLDHNPWHCNCKFEKFRRFAIKSNEFVFNRIECKSPLVHKGKNLLQLKTKLCALDLDLIPIELKPQISIEKLEPVSEEDELPVVLIDKTNKKPLPTCTLANDEMPFQLNQSIYTMKPLNDILHQIRNRNGKLIVNSKYFPRHFALIGFEQTLDNTEKNLSKCWTNEKVNEEKQIIIKSKLESNQAYQLCWVENHLIIPFNCMTFHSYLSEDNETDFLLKIEHKPIFIATVVLSAVFATLIGIALAYGWAKLFPKQIHQRKSFQTTDPSLTPNEMDAIRQMRLDFMRKILSRKNQLNRSRLIKIIFIE